MVYILWLCNEAKGKKGHMPHLPRRPFEMYAACTGQVFITGTALGPLG